MSTPENPQSPTEQGGASPPAAPAVSEPTSTPPAQPSSGEGARASAGEEHDEGPQPGNEAPAPESHGDEEEEGPAPGNEKFPAAQAQGEAGAPGKRKRRRRKKKGPGAAAATTAEGGEAQPAAPGEEGHRARPQVKEAPHDARKKPPRKDRPPRPDRERPAFNVGDIVFGKITDINEDAVLIDLSGKGLAIFDKREIDLPDETPETPGEKEEEEASEPSAEAEAAKPEGESVEAAAPAAEAAAAAAPAEEAPAQPVAEAPAAEPSAADAEAGPSHGPATAADAQPASAAAEPLQEPEPKKEEPKVYPPTALPPLVLEIGAHFVGVVHNDGGRGGLVVVTRHPRRASKAKQMVSTALKENQLVSGLVTGVIKGGVEVDVDGLRAFVPGSHMDLRKGADLMPFVGRRLDFHVTQYGKRGRDVVLSRKPMLESEARAQREAAIAKLQVGAVVEGVVRSVVPFGAFVDIGGIEGLVPLPEMSHNRNEGPSDVFKPGEKVQVKIIKLDDRGKVSLSRKQAIPDPWMEVAKRFAPGTKHAGKVARLQPFGAFIELEPGVDGLLHTIDLTLKKIEHPKEILNVGDSIDVVVASVDAGSHRIALHPAPTGEQANEAPQRVAPHKHVKAQVVAAETGGLVVRILGATGRNARGFIPAGMTGTPRGTDLRKSFPAGQTIEAKVIDVDSRRGEAKLSIRALNEETERSAYQQYKQQVNREARFTFGDLLKNRTQK